MKTLTEYLTKKYFSLVENIDRAQKDLVREVLTKNAIQLVAAHDNIERMRLNLRELRYDIMEHFSTYELYAIVKDNLEYFKEQWPYDLKAVILKKHISRYEDFKALSYRFVE